MDLFKAATTSSVGSGESTFFWIDSWLHGACVRQLAPAVFAAVPRQRWGTTVAEALQGFAWVSHIAGPRSLRLIAEFVQLCREIERVHLTPGVPDPDGNGDPKPDSPWGIPLLGIGDGKDLLPTGRLTGKIPSPSGLAGSGTFPLSPYPKPANPPH